MGWGQMGATEKETDRWLATAYLALCALRDLDPVAEPSHFRQTRLDLHQLLEGMTPDPPGTRADGRPLLRVVASEGVDA